MTPSSPTESRDAHLLPQYVCALRLRLRLCVHCVCKAPLAALVAAADLLRDCACFVQAFPKPDMCAS